MNLLVFLHLYQPPNQQDDILDRIVNECYRPLTAGLLAKSGRKLTLNINGCLTELLITKGYKDVVENIKMLLEKGQIEVTSSAKYHAILPLLPVDEIQRQIELNDVINSATFGKAYRPSGFFSPEMAIDNKTVSVIDGMDLSWIGAPDMSHPSGTPSTNSLVRIKGSKIVPIFRNKGVSSLMLSGVCKSADEFINETRDLHVKDKFWVAVMDAETFGHHRIGHEKFLFEVLDHNFFTTSTISHFIQQSSDKISEEIEIRPCTWTNEEQDFWLDKDTSDSGTVSAQEKNYSRVNSFKLWHDPENPIHALQWELTNLVIQIINDYDDKNSPLWDHARRELDKALASDQYWWASAKPWWSLEMIESGAYQLKQVVSTLTDAVKYMNKIEELYRKILDIAFMWQRTGYIRKAHLSASSTYMQKSFKYRTHSEWYNQLILEFEDEMNKSANERNFEKAIKWRDALIKLKLGTDIYDILHVVDELWTARSLPALKPFFEYTWEEFSLFAKENFISVADKDDFEQWKNNRIQRFYK